MMEERIEQTFETGDEATVSIENVQGNITVEGWDEARVHMIARRKGERARVLFSHEGTRVDIRTEVEPAERGGWGNRGETAEVDYQVRVPRASQVQLKNVHGAVRASGIQGSIAAKSVDGSIQIAQVTGDTRIEATNGSVELKSVQGRAQTFTTNGSISLRDSQLETVVAETVNGSIRLDPLTAGSDVRARSVNGELHLTVPEGVQADLEASGVMLRTSIGLPHQKNSGGRSSWRGVVGSGQSGARVTFTTVNGHVHVSGGHAAPSPASSTTTWAAPVAPTPPTPPTPSTPSTPPTAAGWGELATQVAMNPSPPAPLPPGGEGGRNITASDQPQDVMSVLQAIERGEISVQQGLELMKKLG